MIKGIKYKAKPTPGQAEKLSQWIGCSRVVWNAKCDEDRYLRTYARKYLPIGTFPGIDQKTAHFKGEGTEFLKDCPSQILRNSARIWYLTYQNFFKKLCGRPARKTRAKGNYIQITRELFSISKVDGKWVLFIGSKTNNIGYLDLKWHKKPMSERLPASIWIRVKNGQWTVSFNYDDSFANDAPTNTQKEHFAWLRECTEEELSSKIVSIDRGIARPAQTIDDTYKPTESAFKKQHGRDRYIRRQQRILARQEKGSNRSKKTKKAIAKAHQRTAFSREDFLHKTSKAIVDSGSVIVMEDLKLKNMTKRAKPKKDEQSGKFIKNNAKAKSGLNKALLGVGLGNLEIFIKYKAKAQNKPVFKVNPYNTSNECAACGHTHPDNRCSQAVFQCKSCGVIDNADRQAAKVIKKRAIEAILNSGTELVGPGSYILKVPSGVCSKGKCVDAGTSVESR